VRLLPPDEDIKAMLEELGYSSLEEFMESVLSGFRLSSYEVDLDTLDEMELLDEIRGLELKNKVFRGDRIFISTGVEPSWVSPVVRNIISRGEFLTSYTPYQSEMSQGVLQALYEYQSIMAELLNMDVVNSSMYDGASAAAEALLLGERVARKKRVLIPSNMYRNWRSVIHTYLYGSSIEVKTYPPLSIDEDLSLNVIEDELRKGVSAVLIEFPDSYGYITERVYELADLVHSYGAILVSHVDLWSIFTVLAPGDYSSDVAVAEGQPLGLDMGFGGPLLGVFAVSNEFRLIRNMPGRLIGETITNNGEKAYTMVLQTREQHIRRGDATSNICTNEALSAIQILVNLVVLGKKFFIKRSYEMIKYAHRLKDSLRSLGINTVSTLPFTRRFTIDFSDIDGYDIYHRLISEGYLPGYLWDKNRLTININALHNSTSIINYSASMEEAINDVQTS